MPFIVTFTRAACEPTKITFVVICKESLDNPALKSFLFKTFNGYSGLVNSLSMRINCMFLAAILFIS